MWLAFFVDAPEGVSLWELSMATSETTFPNVRRRRAELRFRISFKFNLVKDAIRMRLLGSSCRRLLRARLLEQQDPPTELYRQQHEVALHHKMGKRRPLE